jgi:xylulokinase
MTLLGLDIGSSSVKAAILRNGDVAGRIVRSFFETDYDGPRVEVAAPRVLNAVADAIHKLGPAAKRVDAIGLTVMSPAWVAMDKSGRALTPIVTHQDRRSVEVAKQIERRVGKSRHLRLAGNRPFPGGISSTTWAWFREHEPALMKRADLVGHLNTMVLRAWTGARVIDPSNASFTGLYSTRDQSRWSDELCDAVGVSRRLLPDVLDADRVAGRVTRAAAARFGLTEDTPVMTGLIDTSAAMLAAGPRPGQLLNVCGSTDVLAVCTAAAHPHERLLTRALGVGHDRWMSVCTIAAAGSALYWAKEQLFADWTIDRFRKELRKLAGRAAAGIANDTVRFDPSLAGDRASIDQRQGAFTGLTLSTTREQMLRAIVDSLARASADRLPILREAAGTIRRSVVVSGGAEDRLDRIMHREWAGRWTFRSITEASLRGLAKLEPKE